MKLLLFLAWTTFCRGSRCDISFGELQPQAHPNMGRIRAEIPLWVLVGGNSMALSTPS
jgi:hypothetical protein